MSAMTHEEYSGSEYRNKNGIFVSIFSQRFPLERGQDRGLHKSLLNLEHGIESDIDLEFLKNIFKLKSFPLKAEVEEKKNIGTQDEIKKYIKNLSQKTEEFDIFIFVFLTYLSYENKDGVIIGDERIHLGEEKCHMDVIYNEVKNVDGMQLKPKIFLIQADDVSLLESKYWKKGDGKGKEIIKPVKIPQDADRLVIMSDIPQRVANPDMDVKEKHPSFMIEAFGEALKENIKLQPEKRQDLLTLTAVINNKVSKRIEEFKDTGKVREEDMYKRADDMFVPLVTSTLTKLLKF